MHSHPQAALRSKPHSPSQLSSSASARWSTELSQQVEAWQRILQQQRRTWADMRKTQTTTLRGAPAGAVWFSSDA